MYYYACDQCNTGGRWPYRNWRRGTCPNCQEYLFDDPAWSRVPRLLFERLRLDGKMSTLVLGIASLQLAILVVALLLDEVPLFHSDGVYILSLLVAVTFLIKRNGKFLVGVKQNYYFELKRRLPAGEVRQVIEDHRKLPIFKMELPLVACIYAARLIEYFMNPLNAEFIARQSYGTDLVGGGLYWIQTPGLGHVLFYLDKVMWFFTGLLVFSFVVLVIFVLRVPRYLERGYARRGKPLEPARILNAILRPHWRVQVVRLLSEFAIIVVLTFLHGVQVLARFHLVAYGIMLVLIAGGVLVAISLVWRDFARIHRQARRISWALSSLQLCCVVERETEGLAYVRTFGGAPAAWQLMEFLVQQPPFAPLWASMREQVVPTGAGKRKAQNGVAVKRVHLNYTTSYFYSFPYGQVAVGIFADDKFPAPVQAVMKAKLREFASRWSDLRRDPEAVTRYFVRDFSNCLSEQWKYRRQAGTNSEARGDGVEVLENSTSDQNPEESRGKGASREGLHRSRGDGHSHGSGNVKGGQGS